MWKCGVVQKFKKWVTCRDTLTSTFWPNFGFFS